METSGSKEPTDAGCDAPTVKRTSYTAGVLFVVGLGLLLIGAGAGYVEGMLGMPPAPRAASSSAFLLDLEEIMDVNWNSSVGAQPQFYMVDSQGLGSTAHITLPSHTLIELSIASYDMGSTPPPPQYDNVTGVLGGHMTLINGTAASGSDTTQAWSSVVSSAPAPMIIHTFTVPGLGLNIPIIGMSTMIAYFYANTTGTYSWACETPCGSGPAGMAGAMATAGWMVGSLTVS